MKQKAVYGDFDASQALGQELNLISWISVTVAIGGVDRLAKLFLRSRNC